MKDKLPYFMHEVYESTEYVIHYFISCCKKPKEIWRFCVKKT